MLGDTPDDMRAARAAGAVPIGVLAPTGARPRDAVAVELATAGLIRSGASRVLRNPQELDGLLR